MHDSEKWKWSRSVVSDPQRPHGLQPTRLLRPWDFPDKSTGVGCHCLLRILLYQTPNNCFVHVVLFLYFSQRSSLPKRALIRKSWNRLETSVLPPTGLCSLRAEWYMMWLFPDCDSLRFSLKNLTENACRYSPVDLSSLSYHLPPKHKIHGRGRYRWG